MVSNHMVKMFWKKSPVSDRVEVEAFWKRNGITMGFVFSYFINTQQSALFTTKKKGKLVVKLLPHNYKVSEMVGEENQ